jgi:hypothetical protein
VQILDESQRLPNRQIGARLGQQKTRMCAIRNNNTAICVCHDCCLLFRSATIKEFVPALAPERARHFRHLLAHGFEKIIN